MKDIISIDYDFTIPKGTDKEKELHLSLEGTRFEDKAGFIFDKLYTICNANIESVEESRKKRSLLHLKECLEIAESLLICKTASSNIYISSEKYKETVLPSTIRTILEKELEKTYIDYKMSIREMSYKEGEELLRGVFMYPFRDENTWEYRKPVLDWICERYNTDYQGFIDDYLCKEPTMEDIQDFITDKYYSCEEIECEQIKDTIEEIKQLIKENTTKGAPIKNLRQLYAVRVFRRLGFSSKNDDLRLMLKCLKVMQLYPKDVTSNIKWLQSIYRNTDKYKIEDATMPF